MLPLQLAGLAFAGKALLTKYTSTYSGSNRAPIYIPKFELPNNINKISAVVNPLESLTKALAPSLSHLKKIAFGESRVSEDYNAIIKEFIPKNATRLKPEHPSYTEEIHLTDLDGDSSEELIASFKLNNEINTIILRKQKKTWYKASEIKNNGYDILNYRDVVDITGTGKRHLLLGLSSKGKPSTIYGYSMEDGSAKEAFAHNYSRLEVLRKSKDKGVPSKVDLAIWSKQNDGTYNIEVLRWNDLEFKAVEDINSYYRKKALPYLVVKTKQAPYSVSNWYNLAEALVKTGAHRDALTAINVGMDLDRKSTFKSKFIALKTKLM